MLRAILTIALFAYPAEFRRDYHSQLFLDLEDRTSERGYALRLFFDVLLSGAVMRAENLWRDIAYAVRTLARAPLFTIVVAGTLAVAIAGNAIIFSALEAVLLRPLPYPHVDRLALVNAKMQTGGASGMMTSLPFAFVQAIAGKSALIEDAGASLANDAHVRVNGEPLALHRGFVTRSYFHTLGVAPYLGRFFSGGANAYQQAVISYEFWREHYGSNPNVLGKAVKIDAKTYVIAGVAPPATVDPSYGSAAPEDLWMLMPRDKMKDYGGFPILRTRAGVTTAALDAEIARLWSAASARDADTFTSGLRVQVKPLRDAVLANSRSLWILFGAVAAVLLIACANIANLMLVRAATRRDQVDVRVALGATWRRIAAQTITETLVLCILGCGIGLAIAAASVKPALALIPGNLPRLATAGIDGSVVLYVCALGIMVTLIAGLLPAFRAGSRNVVARRGVRTRTLLVAAEVAATFALIVCSGLLLRSFVAMSSQPLGFDPAHTYIATFMPPTAPDVADPNAPPLSAATAMRVAQRVKALPGIEDVALGTQVPFNARFWQMGQFYTEAQGPARPGSVHPERMSSATQVSPNFLQTLHIPLLGGRNFTSRDSNVIMVNQAFARQFFNGKSALGKRLYGAGPSSMQIVGIVANTRNTLSQPPKPMVYLPFVKTVPIFQLVIRTTHDDAHLAAGVDRIAQAVYPKIGNPPVTSLEDAVRDDTANARASFILLAALTLMALILALAGIYGVVAFSTERRYHEIGVRVALGATKRDVLGEIVGSALVQSAFGIAAGLVFAAAAANAIDSQLYQTQALDPETFTGAVLLLLACTVVAAAVPARRALRIDPARTLRYE